MSAAACLSKIRETHQRAIGSLRLVLKRRGADTVLDVLRQDGCLKARFPRPVDWMEAVTLNSSGGVAGGDRLDWEFALRAGARATIASQAAERFYRALPGDVPARLRTKLIVGDGAAVEWLPQEAILFDRAALDRALDIDMAADGWFLGVESVLFGRAASGEQVLTARLADTIRVRRAGRLILHDAVRLSGEVASVLHRPAVARGGAAVATLVHVAPDAETHIDALRDAFAAAPGEAGVSAWDGMLIGRIVAGDGAQLRATVAAGLACLRGGRALPRVWMC